MSLLLVKGTKESATINAIIVALKVTVVLIFIFLGWKYINTANYTLTFLKIPVRLVSLVSVVSSGRPPLCSLPTLGSMR